MKSVKKTFELTFSLEEALSDKERFLFEASREQLRATIEGLDLSNRQLENELGDREASVADLRESFSRMLDSRSYWMGKSHENKRVADEARGIAHKLKWALGVSIFANVLMPFVL